MNLVNDFRREQRPTALDVDYDRLEELRDESEALPEGYELLNWLVCRLGRAEK